MCILALVVRPTFTAIARSCVAPRVRTVTNCGSLNRKRPSVCNSRTRRDRMCACCIPVPLQRSPAASTMRSDNAFQMPFNFSLQFGGVVSTEIRNHVSVSPANSCERTRVCSLIQIMISPWQYKCGSVCSRTELQTDARLACNRTRTQNAPTSDAERTEWYMISCSFYFAFSTRRTTWIRVVIFVT